MYIIASFHRAHRDRQCSVYSSRLVHTLQQHLPDAPDRASSPVSVTNWDGYIHWICHIQGQPSPRRRAAFAQAGQILDESFVTIAQIQRQKNPSTDSKWWPDVWDIPSGIGLHLASSASAFQRWEASLELKESGWWLSFPHNLTA